MSSQISLSLRRVSGPALTAAELQAVLRLRARVFVVEQNSPYQDVDGRDLEPGTWHFWLHRDGSAEPLAYLRTLVEPGGVVRIGRVCAAIEARGSGLGARLMAAALAENGAAEYVLDSQTYAQGFYARFGFRAEGEEYMEDGIPHIRMRRPASAHTG